MIKVVVDSSKFRMWQILAMSLGFLGVALGAPQPTAPPTPLEKNSWAFLVAGSYGWYNYRHQADICHAYQVMIAEGIPPERIIVMMYDDIAYNSKNPTPGVVINQPNGTNVYAGVKTDYKGSDVNPTNFLNILKGDKDALKGIGTGRVIESTSDENVFVYFADHGGAGILVFPTENLFAVDLIKTLNDMRQNKSYNKLILYIEACESGSMFDNLLAEDTDVFVMTAAARDENSHGWYCSSYSHSFEIPNVCLGDEFSVRWLEHMDKEGEGTFESFFHQFQYLRSAVTFSHVNMYGDFRFGYDALTPNHDKVSYSDIKMDNNWIAVDSRDAALHHFKVLASRSNDPKHQEDLRELIRGRQKVAELFEELAVAVTPGDHQLRSVVLNEKLPLSEGIFPCYKSLLAQFHSECLGPKNEYISQQSYILANMCILRLDTAKLLREMPTICAPYRAVIKNPVV